MSTTVFYPYVTVPDGISMELDCPGLEVPKGSDGTLLLYELERSRYQVRVSGLVHDETLERLNRCGRITTWLIGRGIEGRVRNAWRLNSGQVFEELLEFDANNFRGTLHLQAVITADDPDGELRRGSRLSWSELRRLHFTEPYSPPGATLRVEWRDFQHEEGLEHFATHLFCLRSQGPEDEPVVLLNKGVAGLPDVLMNKGTHGAAARIRDAVFMQIVHQVWTSVLGGLLESVRDRFADEWDSLTSGEVTSNLSEWQAAMLRSWAPALTGESDREEAVDLLLTDLLRSSGARYLGQLVTEVVPSAIQERFDTRKAFDGLMRDSRLFNP